MASYPKSHRGRRACAVLALAALNASVGLSGDIYLQIDDIAGEARAAGYEDWIEVQTVVSGLSRTPTLGRVAESARAHPLVIGKALDAASPYLLEALLRGASLDEIRLEQPLRDDSGMPSGLARYRFQDARVVSLTQAADGDPAPREQIAFAYSAMAWHYERFPDNFQQGFEVGATWDFLASSGGAAGGGSPPVLPPFDVAQGVPGELLSIPFWFDDPDTPPDQLSVSAWSFAPGLVEVIGVSGQGTQRVLELRLNPRLRAATSIAVTISDGASTTSRFVPIQIGGTETAYEGYLAAAFGQDATAFGEEADPLEDPDEDDLPTIIEYFLGTHPGVFTPPGDAVRIETEAGQNGRQVRLRYFRRTDEPDLSESILASSDLTAWSDLGPPGQSQLETRVIPGASPSYEQVEVLMPLGEQDPASVFLRFVLSGQY